VSEARTQSGRLEGTVVKEIKGTDKTCFEREHMFVLFVSKDDGPSGA
jgi:hypothetical protein